MKTWPSIIFCFLLYNILTANNGTIAYAFPMDSITIDGDLSDWPAGMRIYKVDKFAFGSSLQENNIAAHFRIGYNLETGK